MSVQVRITHAEQIEKLFSQTPKETEKLLSRSINRAAITARTTASVEIRKNYILRASDIKSKIKIRTATNNQLSASIRASGPVTPLIKFDTTPTMPDIMIVRARVKKDSRKKTIQSGFVTRMSNGHINVFTRIGKKRYPIEGLYGPSIAQMLSNNDIVQKMEENAQEELDKRLEHEIKRLLRGET